MTSNEWFLGMLPSDEALAALGQEPELSLLEVAKTRAPVEMGFEGQPENLAEDPQVKKLFKLAVATAAKLKKNAAFAPTPDEQDALHLFVHLVGRPALRTINGELVSPPDNQQQLVANLELVNQRLPGVGRLDTSSGSACGTGWFIAQDLLITNNHVVSALCGISPHQLRDWRQRLDKAAPDVSRAWENEPAKRPRWNPSDTPAGDDVGGRIRKIRALHPTLDAALLEVEGVSASKKLVLPVSPSGPEPEPGLAVYVPGYPAALHGQTNPTVLKLLFGGGISVSKRVAPGKLLDKDGGGHDASTLGGSSGSPVIAFDDHRVRSLHFSGVYGQTNSAVPFWKMRDDAFLADSGIKLAT